jgi:hypothetical protein
MLFDRFSEVVYQYRYISMSRKLYTWIVVIYILALNLERVVKIPY